MLEKTTKSRSELRKQYVTVNGKTIKAREYLEIVARSLPLTFHCGRKVDHLNDVKRYYYAYDIAGINYYVKSIENLSKAR
jgi:hypothetical protein